MTQGTAKECVYPPPSLRTQIQKGSFHGAWRIQTPLLADCEPAMSSCQTFSYRLAPTFVFFLELGLDVRVELENSMGSWSQGTKGICKDPRHYS